MKSVKFSALVAVAVIAASCAKEGTHSVDESNKVALEPMCIEASDESQTKTVLVEKSVNWTDGDKIAVYSNINYNKGYIFPATDIKGNSATFNGEVPVGTTSFFAVYPPERVVSVNAEGVTVNIPAEQTPAAGTFAEEHNITVAQGKKAPGVPSVGDITFNNVCSYVKFTVPAYVSDVTEVKITSSNDIAGDFATASSSIVSNGTNSISMKGSFGAGNTFLFVIAPGTVSNFSINIETASGNWTRTVSTGFTATAGVPVKLGTVDFKQVALKAEAKHVYQDGTGNLFYQDGPDRTLVGTDLSVNLGLDGFLKYASDLKFEVKKKDGTTVRKYESKSVANSTVILTSTAYPDYPYLPYDEGKEYTIEGSYTRPDGSTQTISGTFTVPKPTFTVNAKGMTSYSYYSENNIKQANDCQAETIYGIGGTATISPTLLKKYRYSASYTLDETTYTLDGIKTTDGNKVGQSWGPHTITATYKFDGETVTSEPLTCHITGLPYTAAPPTNSGDHPWSGSANSWESSYVRIHESTITQTFHIPSNINISVYHKANIRRGTVSTTYSFLISGTTIDSKTPGYGSWSYIDQTYYSEIKSQDPTVQCNNTYGNTGPLGTRAEVYSVDIKYR